MRTRCKLVRIIRENLGNTTAAPEGINKPIPSASKPRDSSWHGPPPRDVIEIDDDDEDIPAQRAVADALAATLPETNSATQETTAQQYTRALQRIFEGVNVPDFLARWLPGQLLYHEAMKEILFDTEFHGLYMGMARQMLADVNEILKHYFNADCFGQSYDSKHTADFLEEGLNQWCQICEGATDSADATSEGTGDNYDSFAAGKQPGARKSGVHALVEWLKHTDPSTLYDTPTTEQEMRERFILFLRCKMARGKTDQLSPVTIMSYARSIFSSTCHNSVSYYVREHYGKKDGSDLTSLLFHVDRPTRVLDLGILSHFFPQDERYRAPRQAT